jgi:16S rRNA (guanine527-N7)-methyltransferase
VPARQNSGVSAVDFSSIVRGRLDHARVVATDDAISKLVVYLELLAKWNAKMNLTAFDLARPTSAAIDRLIVEAVEAATFVRETDRVMLDIGSGGGSPAFPFVLAIAHEMRAVLVEARARRSAFLREVARALDLRRVEVDTARFDARWKALGQGAADIVTFRAVRPDADLWAGILHVIHRGSRVIWFTDASTHGNVWPYDQLRWVASTPKFGVYEHL